MKSITVQYQVGVIKFPDFVNTILRRNLEAIPEPFMGFISNTQ